MKKEVVFDNNRSYYYNGIEINYSVETDCSNNGCDFDGICRCGEIYETEIEEITIPFIAKALLEKTKVSDLTHYAFERLLIACGVANPDNWSIRVCGGYYGDEIDGVYFDECDKVNQKITEFFALQNDDERIRFALTEEYGTSLADNLTFSIENVSLDSIEISNPNHFKKCLESNKVYNELIYNHKKNPDWYPALDKHGLCLVRGETHKSILMDGYHRLAAFRKAGIETAKVVLGREKNLD